MHNELQKSMLEKCEIIKSSVLIDLNEYYNDPSEWEEYSESLVEYGIFYSHALDAALDGAVLWGYDLKPFLEQYLLPSTNASLDKSSFQSHHYSLISKYYIDRTLVKLILKGFVCEEFLKEASAYHYKYLHEYDYPDDISFMRSDREPIEAIMSVSLPKMIINKLLGVDYIDVIKKCPSSPKTKNKVWLTAWLFARKLYTYQTHSELTKLWENFVFNWKTGFVDSCLEGFTNNYLVWLYYLYCQEIGRKFSIKDLSHLVLSSPEN